MKLRVGDIFTHESDTDPRYWYEVVLVDIKETPGYYSCKTYNLKDSYTYTTKHDDPTVTLVLPVNATRLEKLIYNIDISNKD